MVGRPVLGGGEVVFGRSVPLRRDGATVRRDDRTDDDNDHGAVFENDSDEPGTSSDLLDWAENEDPKLWKKKASLYVSTSRERWKRQQGQGVHEEKHRTGSALPVSTLAAEIDPESQKPEEKTTTTATEKKPKRDKYQIKEDTMILAYSMLCYDVACLGWMCGVDLSLNRRESGKERGVEVDWDRVLCPLKVLWESVRSEGFGRWVIAGDKTRQKRRRGN